MKEIVDNIDALVSKINKSELGLLDRRNRQIGRHLSDYFKFKRQLAKITTDESNLADAEPTH